MLSACPAGPRAQRSVTLLAAWCHQVMRGTSFSPSMKFAEVLLRGALEMQPWAGQAHRYPMLLNILILKHQKDLTLNGVNKRATFSHHKDASGHPLSVCLVPWLF